MRTSKPTWATPTLARTSPRLRTLFGALAFFMTVSIAEANPVLVDISPAAEGTGLDAKGSAFGSPVDSRPTVPGIEPARPQFNLDPRLPGEMEPNGDAASATPLVLDANGATRVQGNVFPNADVDFYSFSAAAGDRIYAAVMTSASSNGSSDSQLRLIGPDGTTVIEFDNDDGSLGGLSSTIAGATAAAAGTYYLQVNHNSATSQLRPYELYVQRRSGTPVAEVEPNDSPATATPMPASRWVSGTRGTTTDVDYFSMALNAGDTVFLSLDLDPERDNVQWNGRLGLALFGDANNQILVVNDGSTGSVANPLSEAFFFTVRDAGTYFAYVDSTVAAGDATFTYQLSASVIPAPSTATCTTYTSTNVPIAIPAGPGNITSTLTVPGNPRIADIDVAVQLNHTFMQDLDVSLIAPGGNVVGLFTDIGSASAPFQTQMDLVIDDEAAIPFAFAVVRPYRVRPELAYSLGWFDGQDAGGTWTLDIRDDAGGDSGNLTGWSITVCEPPPPPSCPAGFAQQTVYATDFEANDGGFTSSGTANEWERGLPSFAPITTCNGGSNCFATDLDNTYDVSSNQTLLSPAINLTGLSAPVVVNWAQKYQMESASFDQYNVTARQVGTPANALRLFEWLGATMTNSVGSPAVVLQESAGWGRFSARADQFAGQNLELAFNVVGDSTLNFAGAAIDDVSVTACRPLSADLSITKTNGTATSVPGTSTVYTITASNAGPDPVTGATVADTFPAACTSVNWTCVGAGGGSCPANGSGNLNASVDLPVGGTATFSATCAISPAATGTLSNTATVSSSVDDPTPGNNSASDTDTLPPQADLSITLTDTPDPVNAGSSLTYDVTVTNGGASVADAVEASLPLPAGTTFVSVNAGMGGSCTTPAVGANGTVTCTWAGATAPAGSRSASIVAAVGGATVGPLSATATASSSTLDPDPANNSATASTAVIVTADVSLALTVSPAEVAPGLPITFTAVATNNGPGAAQDIQVNLALGAGVAFASANAGAGGVCSTPALGSGGSVNCTWAGATAPGAARTLVVTGYSYTRGSVGASATASSSTNDPTPSNNSAAGSVIVGTGAGAPPPAFIPTASTYGLAFLAVLMGLLGFAAVRRQH